MQLVFYFDYISPYAYVAWHELMGLAKRRGFTVIPQPVLFAGILNAMGQKGPAEIPAKRVYTFKDAARKAHRAGVPLVPPPTHPFNPLAALRATAALAEEKRCDAVTALFEATWGAAFEPRGIEAPAAVSAALTRAGFDGEALVRRGATVEVKDGLRRATDDAINRGVFGVPTIEVTGELFWGVDGLAFVEAYVDGRDPVPNDAIARWGTLPASASRT